MGGLTRVRVARLRASGQLDPTFDPGDGPNGWVSAVAVQADGKVIIGGQFTSVAGTPRNYGFCARHSDSLTARMIAIRSRAFGCIRPQDRRLDGAVCKAVR